MIIRLPVAAGSWKGNQMAKRYFWLKLREGWFRDKRIKKLRTIAGGDTYTIIYLKMQLLSLKDEGKLYFEGVEDDFASEIALEIEEEPDDVKITINYLMSKGLLEVMNADEYLLTEVPSSIGTEQQSAERVRRYRERKALQCNSGVTNCNTEIDIDKEIDKDIDTDIEQEKESDIELKKEKELHSDSPPETEEEPFITLTLNDKSEYPFFRKDIDEYKELYPAVDVEQQFRTMKGWCKDNPTKRKTKRGIRKFVNSWLAREQDKFHPSNGRSYRGGRIENRVTEVDGWQL